MKALRFTLDLCNPVLAGSLEGDPSSEVSLNYIPGSLLRGALIHAFLRASGRKSLNAESDADRLLFLDGRVRFLNAYPVDAAGHRTSPVPRSWVRVKGKPEAAHDLAHPEATRLRLESQESIDEPFCLLSGSTARLIDPRRQVTMHLERDRKVGTAHAGAGTLFRVDALASGQSFGGAIVGDPEGIAQLANLVKEGDEWVIGGDRQAGYGRIRIRRVSDDDWPPGNGSQAASGADGRVVLTLVSDAIVRDCWGRCTGTAGAFVDVLRRRLEAGGHEHDSAVVLEESFVAQRPVGGFNRTWGLPLVQTPALAMGSVLVLHVSGAAAHELLGRLAVEGIGDRRAEGFGCLTITRSVEPSVTLEHGEPGSVPTQRTVIERDSRAGEIGRRMLERMLRAQLDAALLARINITELTGLRPSQIGQFRALVRDNASRQARVATEPVQDYISGVTSRAHARRQFSRARVMVPGSNPEPFLDWLHPLLETPGSVWSLIGPLPAVPSLPGVDVELGDDMASEYALRLIDGVLARAAKRAAKEGAGDG